MDYNIIIGFDSANIREHIKNSELVIKNITILIISNIYDAYKIVDSQLNICINNPKQINILNNIFDFFIENKCVYCELNDWHNFIIFDVDKDLFYKSTYWFLNSDKLNCLEIQKFHYLLLTHNNNFIQYAEYLISINSANYIIFPIHKDLFIVQFMCDSCKKVMSKENFDTLLSGFFCRISSDYRSMENHGISLYKLMHECDILEKYVLYLNDLHKDGNLYPTNYAFFNECIKTNQTNIIDYLHKYGLSIGNFQINNNQILTLLIKNDNIETFLYIIIHFKIPDTIMQITIEDSGSFITKEYVEILYNNGKLESNLILLKNSIKNNPDKNLKKYIRKLKN